MDLSPPFKPGDYVQLTPQGPPLTVTKCQPSEDGEYWEVTVTFVRDNKTVTAVHPIWDISNYGEASATSAEEVF